MAKSKEEIDQIVLGLERFLKDQNRTLKQVGSEFDLDMVKGVVQSMVINRISEALANRINMLDVETLSCLHLALSQVKATPAPTPKRAKPSKPEKSDQH